MAFDSGGVCLGGAGQISRQLLEPRDPGTRQYTFGQIGRMVSGRNHDEKYPFSPVSCRYRYPARGLRHRCSSSLGSRSSPRRGCCPSHSTSVRGAGRAGRPDPSPDANPDRDPNRDADPNPNRDADPNSDRDADADPDSGSDADQLGHAELKRFGPDDVHLQ